MPGFGPGVLAEHGNLAGYVDGRLLAGHIYKPDFDPEGLLSTIPAIVTVLLGTVAGDGLRSRHTNSRKSLQMKGAQNYHKWMRDNIAHSKEEKVQRGHPFAIVDEVDNILCRLHRGNGPARFRPDVRGPGRSALEGLGLALPGPGDERHRRLRRFGAGREKSHADQDHGRGACGQSDGLRLWPLAVAAGRPDARIFDLRFIVRHPLDRPDRPAL